jgi:hypothetical protein
VVGVAPVDDEERIAVSVSVISQEIVGRNDERRVLQDFKHILIGHRRTHGAPPSILARPAPAAASLAHRHTQFP